MDDADTQHGSRFIPSRGAGYMGPTVHGERKKSSTQKFAVTDWGRGVMLLVVVSWRVC